MKILFSIFCLVPVLLHAQVNIFMTGSSTENFDGLASTGSVNTFTNNFTVPNWYSQRTTPSVLYSASNGSSTSGGLYSFGSVGSSERALGAKGSGNTSYGGNFAHGVLLYNNSGDSVTHLEIGYTIEQWRQEIKAVHDTIKVYYKISTNPITQLNPGSSNGWIEVPILHGVNPVLTATGSASALNGNANANRSIHVPVAIPNLILPDGSYMLIKWDDPDHVGEDIPMAIDDVQLAWTVGCSTFSHIQEFACTSYTSPSGNYTFTQSGTYYDTIPNSAGCDSLLTIDLTITSSITFYADTDQDGFGNAQSTTQACIAPTGYVSNNLDCDDSNPLLGSASITAYSDADQDGFGFGAPQLVCSLTTGFSLNELDCDDSNASIHPGATDIPGNGIDEDCDGTDANPLGSELARYEFTGTGACPVISDTVTLQPSGALFSTYASSGTNCSATANVFNNSAWNTTASIDLTEYNSFSILADSCKQLDLNRIIFTHKCSNSGVGALPPSWSMRSSLDGFATTIGGGLILSTDKTDTIYLGTDFDQVQQVTFRIYVQQLGSSQATWRNDNVRVIGTIYSIQPSTYYLDADLDGYGDPLTALTSCTVPAGYVLDNTDCNDTASWINPTTTWYEDADQDSYGSSTSTIVACAQPSGYVQFANDCDDTDASIGSGITYYLDSDQDGYGSNMSVTLCSPAPGFVSNTGDCNDVDASIYPGQIDIPNNGIDENCDGVDGTAALNESENLSFLLYPNPTNGNLILAFTRSDKRQISIKDIQGKQLWITEQTEAFVQLSLTDFLPGTYFITVMEKGQSTTRLLIRE